MIKVMIFLLLMAWAGPVDQVDWRDSGHYTETQRAVILQAVQPLNANVTHASWSRGFRGKVPETWVYLSPLCVRKTYALKRCIRVELQNPEEAAVREDAPWAIREIDHMVLRIVDLGDGANTVSIPQPDNMSYDEMVWVAQRLEGKEFVLPSGKSQILHLKQLLTLGKEVNEQGEVLYEVNIGLRGFAGSLWRLSRQEDDLLFVDRRLWAH